MTKFEHTPGPWHSTESAGHDLHSQSIVYSETGQDIAVVYGASQGDAALIAAAPDMAAALRRFVDCWDAWNKNVPNPTVYKNDNIESARNLLAGVGATGGENSDYCAPPPPMQDLIKALAMTTRALADFMQYLPGKELAACRAQFYANRRILDNLKGV